MHRDTDADATPDAAAGPDGLRAALDDAIDTATGTTPHDPTLALHHGRAARRRRDVVRGGLASVAVVAMVGVGAGAATQGWFVGGHEDVAPAGPALPDPTRLEQPSAPEVGWSNGFEATEGVRFFEDVGDFLPQEPERHDIALVEWQGKRWILHASGSSGAVEGFAAASPARPGETLSEAAVSIAVTLEARPAPSVLGLLGGGQRPFVDEVTVLHASPTFARVEKDAYTVWVLEHDGVEYWAWLGYGSDALPWIERADLTSVLDREAWGADLAVRANDAAPEPLLVAASRADRPSGATSVQSMGFATSIDGVEILASEFTENPESGRLSELPDASYVKVRHQGTEWFVLVSPDHYAQWQVERVGADASIVDFRDWLDANSDDLHVARLAGR